MSTPARKLADETPAGRGGAATLRRAQRVDAEPRSAHPATPVPRRRKKHHLGFALFASAVVGAMVFGIVVLNVLLAQQSFRLDEATQRIDRLGQERLELVGEQAALSAPGRIAEWASRHGMRLPDDIRILRAPADPADPAGAGTPRVAGGAVE